ncbi:TIGR00255 family protein [Limimonas halophila]|uniref:TIGR00255 family protein n=2 Tax=Limimonas halophila TaxID=1082479 RepID=A0A1G7MF89_9PROT|nr:TIGR00255 family protein [Limimonas halophila]
MTGFARRDGGDDQVAWTWELKSVNARGLDVRLRLPNGMEALEQRVRSAVQGVCTRGTVNVTLSLDRGQTQPSFQVNREMLNQLLALSREIAGETEVAPPRVDGLLNIKGVLQTADTPEEDPDVVGARQEKMLADLDGALAELGEARRAEGERLKTAAMAHLDEIAGLIDTARASAAAQPDALRERLRRQVAELLDTDVGLSEDRLAQEAAVLASKADVREELDRLAAHDAAVRELLTQGGAIGRRLDFFCQELNREANTVCSKSSDTALTRTGVALKNAVEQLREQVQNIE